MRNKISILIALLSWYTADAQTQVNNLYWGEMYKSKTFLVRMLGADDQSIYNLKRDKGKMGWTEGKYTYFIEKLDLNGNLVREEEIVFEEGRKFQSAFLTDDGLVVFSIQWDKSSKQNIVFANKLNIQSLQSTDIDMKISSFDYSDGTLWDKGNFVVIQSDDKSKILVYYKLPYAGKDNEKFAFVVLDNTLNVLWNRDVELSYSDKLLKIQSVAVGNDGGVHVFNKLYFDKIKDSRRMDS